MADVSENRRATLTRMPSLFDRSWPLSAGQVHDATAALTLLDRLDRRTIMLTDKAYDGNGIRYDKLADNFLAMIKLASMRFWLCPYEATI